MTTCVAGCQYLPSAEFFAHWLHHGHITLEAHEHYQKRTWRNRTSIVSNADPITLTVPLVKGKHQQQSICEVTIAYHEPWAHLHTNSLQSQYGKAAFANEVLPGIIGIIQSGIPGLWDLNISLLDYVASLIPVNLTYTQTEAFIHVYNMGVTDLRDGVAAGLASIDRDKVPVYSQVQRLEQAFQANLSILDVLCHLGPQSTDYLAKYAAKLYPGT